MHSRLQLLNYECSSTEICGLNFQRAAQDLICIDLLLTSGYCCSLLLVLGVFYFLFLWSTLWSLKGAMNYFTYFTHLPSYHESHYHRIWMGLQQWGVVFGWAAGYQVGQINPGSSARWNDWLTCYKLLINFSLLCISVQGLNGADALFSTGHAHTSGPCGVLSLCSCGYLQLNKLNACTSFTQTV